MEKLCLRHNLRPTLQRLETTHFAQSSKTETVTKGFDARLVNRPFLVLAESRKLKMVG